GEDAVLGSPAGCAFAARGDEHRQRADRAAVVPRARIRGHAAGRRPGLADRGLRGVYRRVLHRPARREDRASAWPHHGLRQDRGPHRGQGADRSRPGDTFRPGGARLVGNVRDPRPGGGRHRPALLGDPPWGHRGQPRWQGEDAPPGDCDSVVRPAGSSGGAAGRGDGRGGRGHAGDGGRLRRPRSPAAPPAHSQPGRRPAARRPAAGRPAAGRPAAGKLGGPGRRGAVSGTRPVHPGSHEAAGRVIALLAARGQTVAVAESLTGGLLAAALTGIPGASAAFRGAVVAYATSLKATLLDVPSLLLDELGAVSPEVAAAMADGVRGRLSATFGAATTGVAGPDATEGKPVGTVHIAVSAAGGTSVRSLVLAGSRDEVRQQTVKETLGLLLHRLGEESS